MKHKINLLLLLIALFVTGLTASAQTDREIQDNSSFLDRVYVGGGLGFQFGDVTLVNLAPIVGYRITNELSAGVGIQYQYRKDKRFNPAFSGSDYGTSIFARYIVSQPFFLQAEYEYLNFEFLTSANGETLRQGFSSFFVGGGISQPIGSNAAFTVSVLYNLSYDETEIPRPYNSPLKINAGINLGF